MRLNLDRDRIILRRAAVACHDSTMMLTGRKSDGRLMPVGKGQPLPGCGGREPD
jgi:hypothetical protein